MGLTGGRRTRVRDCLRLTGAAHTRERKGGANKHHEGGPAGRKPDDGERRWGGDENATEVGRRRGGHVKAAEGGETGVGGGWRIEWLGREIGLHGSRALSG